jgi:Protein of unknown function (DUF3501)
MQKLTADDLLSLELYHKERSRMRAEVLEHKRHRQAPLGPNLTLYFEDRLTMRYQVQEMLRAERIFESEAIAEELASYNPLIPDGTNLKATMMLEYPDAVERRTALENLKDVENAVYLEVGALGRVFAHADEDIARSDETKTSAVHFLRFELSAAMRSALKSGAPLKLGVDHEYYRHELEGSAELRKSLAADFD